MGKHSADAELSQRRPAVCFCHPVPPVVPYVGRHRKPEPPEVRAVRVAHFPADKEWDGGPGFQRHLARLRSAAASGTSVADDMVRDRHGLPPRNVRPTTGDAA